MRLNAIFFSLLSFNLQQQISKSQSNTLFVTSYVRYGRYDKNKIIFEPQNKAGEYEGQRCHSAVLRKRAISFSRR